MLTITWFCLIYLYIRSYEIWKISLGLFLEIWCLYLCGQFAHIYHELLNSYYSRLNNLYQREKCAYHKIVSSKEFLQNIQKLLVRSFFITLIFHIAPNIKRDLLDKKLPTLLSIKNENIIIKLNISYDILIFGKRILMNFFKKTILKFD
jgi:hypothetical protein